MSSANQQIYLTVTVPMWPKPHPEATGLVWGVGVGWWGWGGGGGVRERVTRLRYWFQCQYI